jgi:hypothetical protein
VSGLAIIAGLTGSGRVFPSSLAAFRNRQYMIQSGTLIVNFATAILTKILVS